MNNVKKNNKFRSFAPYLVLLLIIGAILLVANFQGDSVHEIKTGALIKYIEQGKVTEIEITPKSDESVYYVEGKLKGYDEDESFEAIVSTPEMESLTGLIKEYEIEKYDTNKDPGSGWVIPFLLNYFHSYYCRLFLIC